MKTKLSIVLLFTAGALTVSCMDLRDIKKVGPTEDVSVVITPSDEPLTINEAKREVQVVREDVNRWIDWRNQDIAKEEQKIAFIEGIASSGLTAAGETVGMWAGPFAPLATLLIGYATKRRKDASPDQVAKEKMDSYNKGVEIGKAVVAASFPEKDAES